MSGIMKIWFDTEFIEDGKTIDLLSIGMVNERGDVFYAENKEADKSKASQWVVDNVFPHLGEPVYQKSRKEIADGIIEFVGDDLPEFWAWYCSYDWVALCQLYGTMMDLPTGWPMYCRDLKQLVNSLGEPLLPDSPSNAHDALADALWTKDAWESVSVQRQT